MARPPMKDPSKKRKQVCLTLPPDLIAIARSRGINLSQLLEHAILNEISGREEASSSKRK